MSSLKSDRFVPYSEYVQKNFDELLQFYFTSFAGMIIVLVILWLFLDSYWENRLNYYNY